MKPERTGKYAHLLEPNAEIQPKEHRRIRLIVLLSLLALGVVLAIAFVIWRSVQSGPLQVLTNYCQALKDQNYSLAYAQLDSSMQRQETQQEFTDQIALLTQGHSRISNCTVDEGIQTQGSSANGHISLSFDDGSSVKMGVVLKNGQAGWKIRYFVRIAQVGPTPEFFGVGILTLEKTFIIRGKGTHYAALVASSMRALSVLCIDFSRMRIFGELRSVSGKRCKIYSNRYDRHYPYLAQRGPL